MRAINAMKSEISTRFDENLARVENLVNLYSAAGGGRRDVAQSDLLRAAVAFLHASLEELMREILEWKLPDAPSEMFNDVPLAGSAPRTRFTLPELASHRGKNVDAVLRESIREHLLVSSFNHPGDLQRALENAGLSSVPIAPYRRELGPMMSRRHWIVHRADRNEFAGPGHHATRSLSKATVDRWLRAVRGLGRSVLKEL